MSEGPDRQPDEPLEVEIRPGQLEYSCEELLAGHAYDEPLVAGDVRCHGGFVDGRYVSPRTRVRLPAIEAWKARLAAEGHPLVFVPREYIPPQYPNYPQAKLLLQEGIVEPITRSLSMISIVEGFGARVRDVPVPDLREEVLEDVGGTTLAHLDGGLFEAHARDEAGWRREGGHKQMWEAARDLGLDRPTVPGDLLMQLMMSGGRSRAARKPRSFPALSERMEFLVTVMCNVLTVEIFAQDLFHWAQQLLGDPEVSKSPEAAARLVAHIESDEVPHVEYLRTALSELRARTLVSPDGKQQYRGAEVVDTIMAQQLYGIASSRPAEQRAQHRDAIHKHLMQLPDATALRRRFEDLDTGWTFPEEQRIEIQLRYPEHV